MPAKKLKEVETPIITKTRLKRDVKPKKRISLSVPTLSLMGKEAGNFDLPKEIFGREVNKPLLAQALRIYSNNQKSHFSNTKTRGEVEGSTRKIYKQKGTGRARHGSIRAPIFVHGGIALGPKFRKTTLDLPKKMKSAALLSALSQKNIEAEIIILTDLEKASGKTKQMSGFFEKINKQSLRLLSLKQNVPSDKPEFKRSFLIVADQNSDNVLRSIRNIPNARFLDVASLNVFEIIKYQTLLLTKEAVESLEKKLSKDKSQNSEVVEAKEQKKGSKNVK